MFTIRRHQVLLGIFAALLLIPTTHADVFVVLDGIEGESTNESLPRPAIEALSFDWGMSRSDANTGYTSTREMGAVSFQALTFTHYVDKTSPKLMEYCATGKSIPLAMVAVQKTNRDGRPLNYFVVNLKNVIVSAIELGGIDESGRIVEIVSLRYSEYKIEYTQQDAGGKITGKVVTEYNIATQKM